MVEDKKNIEVDDKVFTELLKLVHKYTGITIAPNRQAMIQGRLRPRMKALNFLKFSDYLYYLETHNEEIPLFVDLMTTNETSFYRTPRIWEYLEKDYIPNWYKNNKGNVFFAWSAAASSGEEAHTLAILLHQMKIRHPDFKFQIIGTDISQDILNVAEQGKYSGRSIELFKNTRPELFNSYLRQNLTGDYSLLSEVRQNIKFQKHNLFNKPPFKESFDLVLIRNVLIYFNSEDQEKVLFNVSEAMKQDSLLIIGESESLNRLKTPFAFKIPLVYELINKREQI